VSLILEALKKLDREKQSPERGFLVVASQTWPARTRKPLLALAVGAAIIVGVGAAVVAARRLRGPVTPASVPLPPSVAPPAAAVAPESTPTATPAPLAPASLPPASLPAATPRRPTPAPAAPLAATPPSLVLQAISSRDGRPIALVSDRLVREGDQFDGVTIVRIGDAEVEVEWKGQRSIIRF
jgi:hypothetical protein